jgi:hypothetical protein
MTLAQWVLFILGVLLFLALLWLMERVYKLQRRADWVEAIAGKPLECAAHPPDRMNYLFDVMAKDGAKSASDPFGQHERQAGVYECNHCRRIELGEPRQ